MKMLKRIFIPNEKNEYHPHLLRTAGITSLFAIIVFVFGVFTLQKFVFFGSDYLASVLPSVLVDLANNDRGPTLAVLTPNPILEKAAQAKADDMANKGYFSHTSPDGKTPWYWFDQAGYKYAYAGENLAINFNDSTDVNRAWMNSPLHRDNILNGNFTEIGIATAVGTYQGRPTVFVVQEFGKPVAVKVATTSVATTTTLKTVVSKVVATTTANPALASTNVLGASEITLDAPSAPQYATTFEHTVANPSIILQTIYLVIASLIVLCIIFMIAVKPSRQHIRHMVYAIALLLIIAGLLFIYKTEVMTVVMVG